MIFFRKVNLIWGIISVLFLSSCTLLRSNEPEFDSSSSGPFLLSIDDLNYSLEKINSRDPAYINAYQDLIEYSEAFLDEGPFSVTFNNMTPPNGDKHDYMSIGPYWWPNPNTSDGLPYIYKAGERNPNNGYYDSRGLANLSTSVWYLALAYYFSSKEVYAEKAAELIQTWFLKPDTYMAPHLKYGQGIPGKTNGTGSGIIETRTFIKILEGVSLIYDSPHWTKQNQIALKSWFYKYLDWLLTSKLGEKAEQRDDNHSTWYEAQVAAYSLFIEQEEVATSRAKNLVPQKINSQIDPSGKQLYELKRLNSLSYSVYNLKAIINILSLYKNSDINIDNKMSRNVRNALDWLMPVAKGRGWYYDQEESFNPCSFSKLYRRAAIIFDDSSYEKVVQSLLGNGCSRDLFLLLYPDRSIN